MTKIGNETPQPKPGEFDERCMVRLTSGDYEALIIAGEGESFEWGVARISPPVDISSSEMMNDPVYTLVQAMLGRTATHFTMTVMIVDRRKN